jgi:hypothetical protein
MNSFGIITRRNHLLSPGANLLMKYGRAVSEAIYQ